MIVHIRTPKNVAFSIVTPVYDGEWSTDYITSAAGLDSERSNNKGAFSDLTNELTEIGATGVYYLNLTQAEMNFNIIAVKMVSSTSGANIPIHIIHTFEDGLETANTELAGIPTTVSTLRQLIQFLFEQERNKSTMNKDTGVETLYKEDASTPLGSRTHTDDGTTWTKPEMS